MASTQQEPHSGAMPPITFRRRRRRWLTVLAAMATATATWGIAVQLLGVDLFVRQGTQDPRISSLAVTLTSLAAGLLGWALLALLERWTRRARLVWTVIALVVFAVSLIGPLSATTPAATAVLACMHGIVAGILIVGLGRSAAASRTRDVRPGTEVSP